MLLSSLKRILSIVIAAILIAPSAMAVFAEGDGSEIDVMLPSDIPFKILLSRKSKKGIIYSDEFEIVNRGDDDVAVEISAAKIQIEDEGDYYISDTRELPETGSNIFMELLCLDNQEPSSIVMTDTPSEVVHTYNLKGGEVGKFKFGGTVNEIDGPSWGDTVVQVQICIMIVGSELIAPDEDQPIETEEDQEIANSDSDRDEAMDTEAEAPSQELEHDSTETVDKDDINSENSADDTDTQENRTDAGSDIEETEHDANDGANPTDEQSPAGAANSSAKENNAAANDEKLAENSETLDMPHSS